MALELNGKTLETDEEGFLLDPHEWNETVAQQISLSEKLDLNEALWEIVRFVREHFEQRSTVPDRRRALFLKPWPSATARTRPRANISTNFFPTATASRPARSPACACRAN